MYTILMYQIMLSLMLQQISLWNTSETYLTGNPNWMWLHLNSLKLLVLLIRIISFFFPCCPFSYFFQKSLAQMGILYHTGQK